MKRRMTIIEERLAEWAFYTRNPPHEPGRPSESIEYRIMTGDTAKAGKGAVKGDGGHCRAYRKNRRNTAIIQRRDEVRSILARMKRTKPEHRAVIAQAFESKPGYICDTRMAAGQLNVSQNKYLRLYGEALAFVEGALEKYFAKSA